MSCFILIQEIKVTYLHLKLKCYYYFIDYEVTSKVLELVYIISRHHYKGASPYVNSLATRWHIMGISNPLIQ